MSLLDQFPRVDLCHQPTPIEYCPQFSKQLARNIFIKRDDCTGLAGGGNKTRKLEYLIAAAKQLGADTLITLGGIQSNHARQTAAAAAKFGFDCQLILEEVVGTPKRDYYRNGNVLLDHLLGAKVHQLAAGEDSNKYLAELIASLKQAGKSPYVIPIGGSNEIGSLGYVHCAYELNKQLTQQSITIDKIVLASGSAGTQAGLLAGLIAQQIDIPVIGFCVSRPTTEQEALVEDLLERTLSLLELPIEKAKHKVTADGGYYGEGYGIATPETIDAVKQLASLEGILLDPVYTGKAMAGLIDYCHNGKFSPDENILFLHTGGSQGLFAYQEIF